MARLTRTQIEARAAALKQEIAQMQAARAGLLKQLSQQARAEETRRKILVGAFYLERAKRDERAKAMLLKELGLYLTREDDRTLFGLPPLPASVPPGVAQAGTETATEEVAMEERADASGKRLETA